MLIEQTLKRFYKGVENHGAFFKARTMKTNKVVYFDPQGVPIQDIEEYKNKHLDRLKGKVEVDWDKVLIFSDNGTLMKSFTAKSNKEATEFKTKYQNFIEDTRTNPKNNLEEINQRVKQIFGKNFIPSKDGFEIKGDYEWDVAYYLIQSGLLDYAISLGNIKD